MRHQTYIFFEQQLAVDELNQIPHLEQQRADLSFTPLASEDALCLVRRAHDVHDLPGDLHWRPFRDMISQWSMAEFEQAARAKQLLEWHLNHRFCSRCGQPVRQHRLELAMICARCHYRQYPRISPCVIALIRRDDRLLLARSINSTGYYGLIAGFVEVGETLEQAVQRETQEEIGISVSNIRYVASQPWPFPSNLMLAFEADYAGGELRLQPDEIADAQFFSIDQLPPLPNRGSIAYRLIERAVQSIRSSHSP